MSNCKRNPWTLVDFVPEQDVRVKKFRWGDGGGKTFPLASRGEVEVFLKKYMDTFERLVPFDIPVLVAGGNVLKNLLDLSSSVANIRFTVKDLDLYFKSKDHHKRVLKHAKDNFMCYQKYSTKNSSLYKFYKESFCGVTYVDYTKKFRDDLRTIIEKFDISPCCIGVYKPKNAKTWKDLVIVYNGAFVRAARHGNLEFIQFNTGSKKRHATRIVKYYHRGFKEISYRGILHVSRMMTEWYNENVFYGGVETDEETGILYIKKKKNIAIQYAKSVRNHIPF